MYNSVAEAEQAKLDLVAKIQDIDTQLSHKASQFKVGRMPNAEYKKYLEWKASATFARKELNKELQKTKLWIKNAVETTKSSNDKQKKTATALLDELAVLVKDLIANGAELTKEERALVMEIEAFLSTTKERGKS